MLRIALAECRRLWLVYPFGVAIWMLVTFTIYRELARFDCDALTHPDCRLVVTKMLFLCLVYGLGPAVGWAQGGQYGPWAGSPGTFRLIETLPFSMLRLNLSRIVTGIAFMVPALVTWIAVFAVWRRLDLPFSGWVAVFAALVMIAFQVLALNSRILRYLLPALFALLFIPGSERLLSFCFEGMTRAWPSLLLAALILAYGSWSLRQTPPHYAL